MAEENYVHCLDHKNDFEKMAVNVVVSNEVDAIDNTIERKADETDEELVDNPSKEGVRSNVEIFDKAAVRIFVGDLDGDSFKAVVPRQNS